MKKKSRFLQTPIEPFAVEAGLTADEILSRMERISFQGRSLATAHRIWRKMLEDTRRFSLGMAGALSAGGPPDDRRASHHAPVHRLPGVNRREPVSRPARNRGQHHYLGSAHADDAMLAKGSIDRVYDTFASEEEFIGNDNRTADFAGRSNCALHQEFQTAPVASVEMTAGRHLDERIGERADLLPRHR